VAARVLALLLALAALAGCGGGSPSGGPGEGDAGTAALWVTRNEGAEVVLTADVPAGLTVLQALDRVADVETRYGGRFVQSIEGIAGSLAERRDWFYFLNGIEPDVGAAEVRLHPGDVAWWDFRSWSGRMERPVVVGAFPEPFLHGWDGAARPLEIVAPPGLADEAAALEQLLAPAGQGSPNRFELIVDDDARGAVLSATRGPANDGPVTFTLSGARDAVAAAAARLADDPSVVRYRYTARFDGDRRGLG
jgi:hypothetical protein